MECQSERGKRRDKQKSKHEKFGQYTQKHVRQVEQNLQNIKQKELCSNKTKKK